MPKSWKWKVALLCLLVVASVYLLIPTIFNFREKAEDYAAEGLDLPLYYKAFYQKGINLGLDLRGGIYLEFEVELSEATTNKLDLIADDLGRQFKDESIDAVVKHNIKNNELLVTSEGGGELAGAIDFIASRYQNILVNKGLQNQYVIFKFTKSYLKNLHDEISKQSVEKVRNRIDRYGVSEPSIRRLGSNRLAVELPGIKNPDRAVDLIKKAGMLEFKLVDQAVDLSKLKTITAEARKNKSINISNFTPDAVREINDYLYETNSIPTDRQIAYEILRDPMTGKITGGRPYLLERKSELTGSMLKNAMVDFQNNNPYVSLTFDVEGAKVFGKITSENVGEKLAIVLDGAVTSAPVIKDAIHGGRAQVTLGIGDFNTLKKEAEDLVLVLQEGALPARLTEATKTVVGPSLGADSIKKGVMATIIGGIIVGLFMIVYYKGAGLIADAALILNLLFILAALALFQATLTLPGIAGIVLTLGMAVDANVLIYERLREELRLGKSAIQAVQSGYQNALRTIIDANVTTLIAGLVLYQFGTGPVRGFAVTLIIGLAVSMFTACVCTRLVFDYLVLKKKVTKLSV